MSGAPQQSPLPSQRRPPTLGDLPLIAQQVAAGSYDGAEAALRVLLGQHPDHPHVLHVSGLLAHARRDLPRAHALMARSIERAPRVAGFHNNLGEVFRAAGDLEGAERCYRKALEIDPKLADAEANLGLCLASADRLTEAVEHYRRAIALNPKLPHPHNSLGIAYAKLGRLDDAIECYRRAIAIDPGYGHAQSNYLLALNYQPDVSRREVFEAHAAYGRGLAERVAASRRAHANDRDPDRRIRVGYVSPDFRKHSVAYAVEPLLAAHDHNAVHVTCYSDVLAPDDVTRRLKRSSDAWRDTAGFSAAQLADAIRADEIDVLVDLAGHTANNRLAVFAMKPAPVQVTLFGYPNTTGLPTMDYRATDVVSDPAGAESFHTERLLRLERLSWCFRGSEEAPDVNELPARSRGYVTFGSFNNVYKITKAAARTWGRILDAVAESKLLVLVAKGAEQEYVKALFAGAGVDGARLVLEPKRARREYLELVASVDVALDPWPYNGGITTCECLWQGVPVVALAGNGYVSRQGVAILASVGLSGLIGQDAEGYVEAAVRLAGDRGALGAMRAGLRGRMAGSAVCDAAGFARAIEGAYRETFAAWCGAR